MTTIQWYESNGYGKRSHKKNPKITIKGKNAYLSKLFIENIAKKRDYIEFGILEGYGTDIIAVKVHEKKTDGALSIARTNGGGNVTIVGFYNFMLSKGLGDGTYTHKQSTKDVHYFEYTKRV